MDVDFDLVIRASVGMLVITSPFDPVKLLFFNETVEQQQIGRSAGAGRLTLYVAVILTISVVIMARLGGLILASLGFQMLLNGIKNFFA